MNVSYRLRRFPTTEPATALLVPSFEPAAVLELCARLGFDPVPEIFATAEGFLLKLPRPLAGSAAGALRLRGLSANLFLPVDAELIPALLEEEAAALVRDRGLVFLPGQRVLSFDPASPVALTALMKVDRVRRHGWQPLPARPELAEDVTEIGLEMPDLGPEEMLAQGGEGIGAEAPRPDDAGLPRKMLGQSLMGLGKGLAWLGKALGLGGLAGLGARLMAGALNLAPRLSEKLMGKQEASLRDLLKDFQDGNVEKALRRALPIGADNARGGAPAATAQLPVHNLFYSLQGLLGPRGPASFWFSQDDTYRALEREYRKQAEMATRRGDYRRAAFIYAKLLNDFRSAAAALAGGGLHRDAALIYLQMLKDYQAAAREYEAAGEVDRAVDLYRKHGEHALAGDLLRRAGEEERALAEYGLAAARLVETGQGHYQAGELLRTRAQRPDLAQAYYEEGWRQRPTGTAVSCALRIAEFQAGAGNPGGVVKLVDEAEAFLSQPGNVEPAGHFFNEIARLARTPGLGDVKDDLHDRALQGIAGKLRQSASAAAGLVPVLLPATSVWSAPQVRDAQAAAGVKPLVKKADASCTFVRLHAGLVRSVCHAPASGDLFVGFESGELVHYHPTTGNVELMYKDHGPVTSLAATQSGSYVIALSQRGQGSGCLSTFSRSVGYRMAHYRVLKTPHYAWLCPEIGSDSMVSVWDGACFRYHRLPDLLTVSVERNATVPVERNEPADGNQAVAGLAWPRPLSTSVVAFLPSELRFFPSPGAAPLEHALGWTPAVPYDGEQPFDPEQTQEADLFQLGNAVLAWRIQEPEILEVAGLNVYGNIHVTTINVKDPLTLRVSTESWQQHDRYRAVAWVRPGLLAGVTESGIDWIRVPKGKLQGRTWAALPRALACFHNQNGRELLVVCGNGTLARVPLAS
jgi:tetratricopeptide (TPR) repeat protein